MPYWDFFVAVNECFNLPFREENWSFQNRLEITENVLFKME